MIRYKCTNCGIDLESPNKLAGQFAKCPKCNDHINVPFSVTIGHHTPPDKKSANICPAGTLFGATRCKCTLQISTEMVTLRTLRPTKTISYIWAIPLTIFSAFCILVAGWAPFVPGALGWVFIIFVFNRAYGRQEFFTDPTLFHVQLDGKDGMAYIEMPDGKWVAVQVDKDKKSDFVKAIREAYPSR